MAKYLVTASYSADGAKGLIKEGGSSRKAVLSHMLEKLGGRLECFYYAMGKWDVYTIFDLPDAVSATAVALAVNASGAARIRTTCLMTCEEVDQAVKKVPAYRAPGA